MFNELKTELAFAMGYLKVTGKVLGIFSRIPAWMCLKVLEKRCGSF